MINDAMNVYNYKAMIKYTTTRNAMANCKKVKNYAKLDRNNCRCFSTKQNKF